MNNINWKEKLSSRKFWMAIVAFITPIMFMLNIAETTVENIASIVMAGGALISYILVEGWVDVNRDNGEGGVE